MTTTTALRVSLLAAALAAIGCRTPDHYVNRKADLGALQKVAVAPFDNMSDERFAGEKLQRLFLAELLNRGAFEVSEPARVLRALREERVENASDMSPEQIQKVGKALGVDAIFLGTVVDFAENRGGSGEGPFVTVQLKLVETAAGVTVWSVTRHRTGAGVGSKLFGLRPPPSTVVATELVRDALDALAP